MQGKDTASYLVLAVGNARVKISQNFGSQNEQLIKWQDYRVQA